MFNFVNGDMFKDLSQASYAINTVNCHGVAGKGVALEFKKLFPSWFSWYRQVCHDRKIKPGQVFPFVPHKDLIILNMATKDNWWEPSRYEWIDEGLQNLHDCVRDYGTHNKEILLLPPPGCGNGGLAWETVKPMIKRHLKDLECEVRVYEP